MVVKFCLCAVRSSSIRGTCGHHNENPQSSTQRHFRPRKQKRDDRHGVGGVAVIDSFKLAMHNAGIEPPGEIMADRILHRFTVTGDKARSENGWYVVYADDPAAGAFGCWKRGISETWSHKTCQTMTPEEKTAYTAKLEALKRQREEERERIQAACRAWCAATWDKATPAPDDHPYLERKGVKAHGLKLYKGSLIVQVQALDGSVHGLQFIAPDGSKKFKTGTDKAGHYAKIGKSKDKTAIVCEGWATGASIHEATGHAVVVAFDAGNLLSVARNIRSRCPDFKIIIAADDDHATEGNPGLTKATEAVQTINGLLAIPSFPSSRGPKDTDFNDLARVSGPDAVRSCLEAAATVDPIQSEGNPAEDTAEHGRKPLFVSALTFFDEDIPPKYLVDKRIEEDSGFLVVGPSGEGKSFFGMDLGCAVSTGGATLGGFRCKRGAVLYLAGEGLQGMRRRARAWAKHNGMTAKDIELLYVSSGTIEFNGHGLREAIIEAKKIEAFHNVPIRLIVIDTMARHMVGEENSAKDTGEFIRYLDDLRESFPGSVALVVHHTGHGEDTKGRGRGSSAIPAAMDTIIVCNKGVLTFTKQKDGEIPPPVEFKLLPVQIGTDEDGEPVTSCIVEYGAKAAKHREAVLTKQEKITYRLLQEAGDVGLLIGDLKQKFFDSRRAIDPEAKAHAIRTAFTRTIEGLLEKHVICQNQHLITLYDDKTSQITLSSHLNICDGEIQSQTSHTLIECDESDASKVMTLTEADFEFEAVAV
jgi:putative DNA primase/helicase